MKNKILLLMIVFSIVSISNQASAQTQFIKYKKYLIPISIASGIQVEDQLKICGIKLCKQDGQTEVFLRGSSWINLFDTDNDESSSYGIPEVEIKKYLDWMSDTNLNYVVFKVSYFTTKDTPVCSSDYACDDDYDQAQLDELKNYVEYARSRGIYVQLTLFDTWARGKGTQTTLHFDSGPDRPFSGSEQVMNVWATDNTNKTRTLNYLTYIVEQFRDYPNVFFEFGNELDHDPHGTDTTDHTNLITNSVALLARYHSLTSVNGANDRPISVSEESLWNINVNMHGQHGSYPKNPSTLGKPIIYNELVEGFGPDNSCSTPSRSVFDYTDQIDCANNTPSYKYMNSQIKSTGHVGTICGASLYRIDSTNSVISSTPNASALEVYSHCGAL